MKTVIQRVLQASVTIDGSVFAGIKSGILVFIGIEDADSNEDIVWLSNKIVNLRIFDDENGVMNLSIIDLGLEILIVSQFTLFASTKKGNRPSYIRSAQPETAVPLYNYFLQEMENLLQKKVSAGIFGAMMQVDLTNDGPVTLLIDSKNKE